MEPAEVTALLAAALIGWAVGRRALRAPLARPTRAIVGGGLRASQVAVTTFGHVTSMTATAAGAGLGQLARIAAAPSPPSGGGQTHPPSAPGLPSTTTVEPGLDVPTDSTLPNS